MSVHQVGLHRVKWIDAHAFKELLKLVRRFVGGCTVERGVCRGISRSRRQGRVLAPNL